MSVNFQVFQCFIVVISFHIVLFFISGALKSASTVSLVQCVLKG